jgi:hypothetical protein
MARLARLVLGVFTALAAVAGLVPPAGAEAPRDGMVFATCVVTARSGRRSADLHGVRVLQVDAGPPMLLDAARVAPGQALAFVWTLADLLDADQRYRYSVDLRDGHGVRYIVATEDRAHAHTVTLLSDARGRHLKALDQFSNAPTNYELSLKTVRFEFATSLVPELHGAVTWTTSVTVNGRRADVCRATTPVSVP